MHYSALSCDQDWCLSPCQSLQHTRLLEWSVAALAVVPPAWTTWPPFFRVVADKRAGSLEHFPCCCLPRLLLQQSHCAALPPGFGPLLEPEMRLLQVGQLM